MSLDLGPLGVAQVVGDNTGGISDSVEPSDISGIVSSASSYNLIGTGGSGGLTNDANGNQVGIANPGLDPNGLQWNGGATQTIALLPGSPAIDAGSNALAINPTTGLPLTTDQRGAGFARIVGGTVDIGAFEFYPEVTITSITAVSRGPVLKSRTSASMTSARSRSGFLA